ncbi:MAG: hypothetical protein MMC23_007032 [Stictis urceolatum]|nr:hypothetical protein [Stictis urceolata]
MKLLRFSKIRPPLSLPRTRLLSTSKPTNRPVSLLPIPVLPSSDIPTFRASAFHASLPAILPRGTFSSLPATKKWTTRASPTSPTHFALPYLEQYESAILPHEFTSTSTPTSSSSDSPDSPDQRSAPATSFHRADAPLGIFLAWAAMTSTSTSTSSSSPKRSTSRLTISQAPLSSLPQALLEDIPTPPLVLEAGKGDVYADSIWLGLAPTSTPLHRDPNPNLLVQVAGRKRVRMVRPEVGGRVLEAVRAGDGGGGGGGSGRVRGEEMMVGEERRGLEEWVWGREGVDVGVVEMWEGEIGEGDGVFVPVGWWHAVRGVGEGAVASVNWWFR